MTPAYLSKQKRSQNEQLTFFFVNFFFHFMHVVCCEEKLFVVFMAEAHINRTHTANPKYIPEIKV